MKDARLKALLKLTEMLAEHGVSYRAVPLGLEILATCWDVGATAEHAVSGLITGLGLQVQPDGLRNALLAWYSEVGVWLGKTR